MIRLKINLRKLTDFRTFTGKDGAEYAAFPIKANAIYMTEKGASMDVTLMTNRDGRDQYDNDGFATLDLGKERRLASETVPSGRGHQGRPETIRALPDGDAFFLTVRATFKKGSDKTELDIIDRMTEPGLLVIDELHERGETAFEDRLLTHLIDARYGARRPTILIANLTKDELGKSLGPSIVDRASENGRRIDFTWTSYRRA